MPRFGRHFLAALRETQAKVCLTDGDRVDISRATLSKRHPEDGVVRAVESELVVPSRDALGSGAAKANAALECGGAALEAEEVARVGVGRRG